jgi:hypothetical protein
MEQVLGIRCGTTAKMESKNEIALSGYSRPEPEAFSLSFDFGDQFI